MAVTTEFHRIDIFAKKTLPNNRFSCQIIEVKRHPSAALRALGQVLGYCNWFEAYSLYLFGYFCYLPVVASVGEIDENQKEVFAAFYVKYVDLSKILPRFKGVKENWK